MKKETVKTEPSRQEKLEEYVLQVIRKRKSPITGGELASMASAKYKICCTDVEIRGIIRDLRHKGEYIIGKSTGYVLAADIEEVDNYIKARLAEMKKEAQALNHMRWGFQLSRVGI